MLAFQTDNKCLTGTGYFSFAFPTDSSVYTGYVEGDDDDSAHDSELEQAWRDFLNI